MILTEFQGLTLSTPSLVLTKKDLYLCLVFKTWKAGNSPDAEEGDGNQGCIFPFKYNGVEYNECTDVQWKNKWCATATNWKDEYIGAWGDCEIRKRMF